MSREISLPEISGVTLEQKKILVAEFRRKLPENFIGTSGESKRIKISRMAQ